MRCHRCRGMMIYEKFYGHCEQFFGWKCISCGEIVDQVILDNRRPRVALGPRAQKGGLPMRERMFIIF